MEGLLPFFYLFPSTCLLPWDNLMAVLSFDDVFHLLPTQLGFSGMIFFFQDIQLVIFPEMDAVSLTFQTCFPGFWKTETLTDLSHFLPQEQKLFSYLSCLMPGFFQCFRPYAAFMSSDAKILHLMRNKTMLNTCICHDLWVLRMNYPDFRQGVKARILALPQFFHWELQEKENSLGVPEFL